MFLLSLLLDLGEFQNFFGTLHNLVEANTILTRFFFSFEGQRENENERERERGGRETLFQFLALTFHIELIVSKIKENV